jgi:4-carboxymuconolactone decarboxylase
MKKKIISSYVWCFTIFALVSISGGTVMADDRYVRGLKKLEEIDGAAGKNVIQSLQDISPDLARYTIEYPFGDVYSRPGLDLRAREIATIAALTALGNATPQLKVHINAGLNVGLKPEEITEVILQMSVYAGFPAALNGMFAAKEVFKERKITVIAPAVAK